MKVKDIIKRQTTMVAMAVILVVITAIGVSYSVFFDVEKNQSNQTITAGIFKLTVTGNSKLTDFNAKTDVIPQQLLHIRLVILVH